MDKTSENIEASDDEQETKKKNQNRLKIKEI